MLIRDIIESDYEQLLYLFQEFSEFEQLPDKMTNSME